jgi:hypothetical protein
MSAALAAIRGSEEIAAFPAVVAQTRIRDDLPAAAWEPEWEISEERSVAEALEPEAGRESEPERATWVEPSAEAALERLLPERLAEHSVRKETLKATPVIVQRQVAARQLAPHPEQERLSQVHLQRSRHRGPAAPFRFPLVLPALHRKARTPA